MVIHIAKENLKGKKEKKKEAMTKKTARSKFSELLLCGLSYPALMQLVEDSHVLYEEAWAGMLFLTLGSLRHCQYIMTTRYGKGWAGGQGAQRIRDTLRKMQGELQKSAWISWREAWLRHPLNSAQPFFDDDVKIAFDTMPIPVDDLNDDGTYFQPKYAEAVVKLFCCITLSGFIVDIGFSVTSEGDEDGFLYTGSSSDKVIMDASTVLQSLRQHGLRALADGGFYANPQVIIPYSKRDIWPTRLSARQTVQEWEEAADEKMRWNTVFSHFRGRSEHPFGRSLLGRFKAFVEWRWSVDLLHSAIYVACAALNMELQWRYANKGRYEPLTIEKVKEIESKARAHKIESNRYPRPKKDPRPARKRLRLQPVAVPAYRRVDIAELVARKYLTRKDRKHVER